MAKADNQDTTTVEGGNVIRLSSHFGKSLNRAADNWGIAAMYSKGSLSHDLMSRCILMTVAAESIRAGKTAGNEAVAALIYRVAESLKEQSERADHLERGLEKWKKRAKRR